MGIYRIWGTDEQRFLLACKGMLPVSRPHSHPKKATAQRSFGIDWEQFVGEHL